ncbi:MAG TPA: hypothetical protein DCP71_07860, partial [Verrucomicrobiales bacterium]|nr:hypothetical protein [Verrucomicrobiales bacterium]
MLCLHPFYVTCLFEVNGGGLSSDGISEGALVGRTVDGALGATCATMEKAQDLGSCAFEEEWRRSRDEEEAARWDNVPYLEADRLRSCEANVR